MRLVGDHVALDELVAYLLAPGRYGIAALILPLTPRTGVAHRQQCHAHRPGPAHLHRRIDPVV